MSYKLISSANETSKHSADVAALLFHGGKLYSGGEDGKIKIWSPNLELENVIEAHPVNVYCIAANEKYIFSGSNDGTLKCWDIRSHNLAKKIHECPTDEILQLYYDQASERLYSGDDKGIVRAWNGDEIVGQYNVMEEIRGLCAKGDFIFTAGNMDVTVTEIKKGSKTLYTTRNVEEGRGPMCLIDSTVCFINRDGRSVSILDKSETGFKIVANLKEHEMIVNALAGITSENGPVLFSGGYDNQLKVWNLDKREIISSNSVGKCINAIAVGDNYKTVYVAGANGFIDKFELKP